MCRREVVHSKNLFYDETLVATEDYDLWERASNVTHLSNVDEVLLGYRKHSAAATSRNGEAGKKMYKNIMRRQISRLIAAPEEHQIELHYRIFTEGPHPSEASLAEIRNWFDQLASANRRTNLYPPALLEVLARRPFKWVRQNGASVAAHRQQRLKEVALFYRRTPRCGGKKLPAIFYQSPITRAPCALFVRLPVCCLEGGSGRRIRQWVWR